MDTQIFWNIIENYNEHTQIAQIFLLILIVISVILSYIKKVNWAAKFVLGITYLFIGIIFFAYYGTEPIQKIFALPLFLLCSILFLYESWRNKDDILVAPTYWQIILLLCYLIYPLISILLGKYFPRMTTYIMPCPIVSLSIVIYAGYRKRNIILLVLLTIWGLTGIKSVFLNVYEDIILLICGLYGSVLCLNEMKRIKKSK